MTVDVSAVCAVVAVLISIVGLVSAFIRNGGADIDSVRKEFGPRFDSMRTEFEAKMARCAAEQTTARHDAANVLGGRLGQVENDLRHLNDRALTKSEGSEMEKRIMGSINELKSDVRESRDALTRIMAKLGVDRHGAD